ncbi:MAG: FAD-binding protein [Candidatus Eisenbacteria bacterium]|nr:FAD-binding protein [Candidatus Eisenbacteria bacterium]
MGNSIAVVEPRSGGGPAAVVESADKIRESYADYLTDESRYGPPEAELLALAEDESHVADVLLRARDERSSVTLSAGRTGIVGGAVPRGGFLLSLARMDRVLGARMTEDGELLLTLEPGVTIAGLDERLRSGELGLDPADLDDGGRDALEAIAEPPGWFYPPDPTEDTAHLGATVATNASGSRSFRYGPTRRHVRGLRVVLPSGEVVDADRGDCVAEGRRFELSTGDGVVPVDVPTYEMPSTKNAAGYFARPGMDLVDLFIGSEGTLGVITEIRVALSRRPEGMLSAIAFFDSDDEAVAFVSDARRESETGVRPLALELFDSRSLDFLRERKDEEGAGSELPELPGDARSGVLFEQDYVEDDLLELYEAWEALLVRHGSSMERTWGGMEESEQKRLKALRHGLPEQVNAVIARAKAEHPEIHKIGTDAAVPAESLQEALSHCRDLMSGTGLSYIIFGHIGDSHLHLNILPADPRELAQGKELAMAIARKSVELGGTVSAEHGIGKIKHDFLRIMYGDDGLREMAKVKRALDPECVLNRDVMFPADLV